MIVVDVNILAYLYIPGGRTEQAEKALRKDPEWAAPLLWRSELRNVLVNYLRKKMLLLDQAHAIMETALDKMQGYEYDLPSRAILELASKSMCSAYDCEYAALAQALNVPLITADQKILAQFPDIAISLDNFCSENSTL